MLSELATACGMRRGKSTRAVFREARMIDALAEELQELDFAESEGWTCQTEEGVSRAEGGKQKWLGICWRWRRNTSPSPDRSRTCAGRCWRALPMGPVAREKRRALPKPGQSRAGLHPNAAKAAEAERADHRSPAGVAQNGNGGTGAGHGLQGQHDDRAIEAHEGEGADRARHRKRRMGRIRLTPEERAELLAPGPAVANSAPWLKPITQYGLRTETSEAAGARFG